MLKSIRELRQWPGDTRSLLQTIQTMTLSDVDECVTHSKVSKPVRGYLHFEGCNMPNPTSIGSLPHEVALILREALRAVRMAVTHHDLELGYSRLAAIYSELPDRCEISRLTLVNIPFRSMTVRQVDFCVRLYDYLMKALDASSDYDDWRSVARQMLVNKRSIPLHASPEDIYSRMQAVVSELLAI